MDLYDDQVIQTMYPVMIYWFIAIPLIIFKFTRDGLYF